jgi:antitoxin component of MazEF toxin-antitoxin module
MTRKVLKAGKSLVIALPREAIEALGLSAGSEIDLRVDAKHGQIIISARSSPLPVADGSFASQVDVFIKKYRPVLKKLARVE